ncbi:MAG: exonuclease subunit SbcD, partial [Clostridia bacterium]|nr:exonuclease subunit SbcD [Clostridia bacterium]
MKFLHTSDLHIGKKLDGITRLDEQREVLGEIVSIARERGVDAVIISGDVFDTFVPSADAEAAFYDFAAELSDKKRAVIVISGNHDDEDRLFASGVLALKNGIFFCGRDNAFPKMQVGNVKIIDSGRYFIELSDGKDVPLHRTKQKVMNIFVIAVIMAFFIGEVFLLDMYYKKKYKTGADSNVAPVKADAANPIQNVLPTVIRVVVSEDINKLADYKSELADL